MFLRKILNVVFIVCLANFYNVNCIQSNYVRDVGVATAFLVPGLVATGYSVKIIKNMIHNYFVCRNERQFLEKLGIKVIDEYEFKPDYTRHTIRITIPQNFTQEQRNQVGEHWAKLEAVVNPHSADRILLPWTLSAAGVLTFIGSCVLWGSLERMSHNNSI